MAVVMIVCCVTYYYQGDEQPSISHTHQGFGTRQQGQNAPEEHLAKEPLKHLLPAKPAHATAAAAAAAPGPERTERVATPKAAEAAALFYLVGIKSGWGSCV